MYKGYFKSVAKHNATRLLSKNAQKVHIALAHIGVPRNKAWISTYAAMNLGLTTRQTSAALEELQKNSLVILEKRRRNKNSTEHLYHYLENAPISETWLVEQVRRGVASANGFDAWKAKVAAEPLSIRSILIRDYFAKINCALGAINLLVALKGLRNKYAGERKILVKYYYRGFKWMRRDPEYAVIFPLIRYDLQKYVLFGGQDIQHPLQEAWKFMENINPKLGEKYPGMECMCGHLIEDHETSAENSGCLIDACECAQFGQKVTIGREERKA